MIRGQWTLNATCSLRSGKSQRLQRLNGGLGSLGSGLLDDLALQLASLGAELVVVRLDQPIVEAADVLHGAQAVRRHAQLDALAECVGNERYVLQVRQERPLGLVIG